jgi:hypothetical protein
MGIFSEFFGSSSSSTAPPSVTTPDISEGQVRALFYLWNEALATGDSRIVARRYSEDAILLPTAVSTIMQGQINSKRRAIECNRPHRWIVVYEFFSANSHFFSCSYVLRICVVRWTTNGLRWHQRLLWQLFAT